MASLMTSFERWRSGLLLAVAFSFFFYQAVSLSFMKGFMNINPNIIEAFGKIGAIVLLIICFMMLYFSWRSHNSDHNIRGALNDELFKHNQNTAIVFGFKTTFLIVSSLFFYVQKTSLTSIDVARIIMATMFVTTALRLAYLEMKHA